MSKKTTKERVIDYFKKKGTYSKYKKDGSLERRIKRGVQMAEAKAKKDSVKAVSKKKYLRKQNRNVDMNVKPELLEVVQGAGELAGEPSLTISSGRRSKEKTLDLLKQRKQKRLSALPMGVGQDLIDRYLLRGTYEQRGNLPYTKKDNIGIGKINQELNTLVKNKILSNTQANKLKKEIKGIRSDFGGYESAHIPRPGEELGGKVDIPKSSMTPERAFKFLHTLENVPGLKVLNEEKAGKAGVIDIELKGDKEKAMEYIQGRKKSQKFMQQTNKNMQDIIKKVKTITKTKEFLQPDVEEKSKRLQHMALSSLLKR